MAFTATMYGNVQSRAFGKEIDWLNDTIKVMLVDNTYVFDKDNHQYKDAIVGEVVGTGYTAGGATVTAKVRTYTGSTDVTKFDSNDVSWPASNITAYGAVIYDDTPSTDATKPLIMFVDFGGAQTSSNGTFTVQWHADGIFTGLA